MNVNVRVRANGASLGSTFATVGDLAASRYALGIFAFFVLVGVVIAYAAFGTRGVYVNFFMLYAACYGFACALVATAVNALAAGGDVGRRGAVVVALWVALLVPAVAGIPAVEKLCDTYAWRSVGAVTAAIGMPVQDVKRVSTAKLYPDGTSYDANLHGGVVSLQIADTPTTFARCWNVEVFAEGADRTRVSEIRARLAPGIGSFADAARILARYHTTLLADGWRDGPSEGYVTRGETAIRLAPKRLDREDDPARPNGIWGADIAIVRAGALPN